MLLHVGQERNAQIDLILAGTLASVAGALNAVGFLMAGSFTANMTGNLSAMADYMGAGAMDLALPFGILVMAFILGAALAAFGIESGRRRGLRRVYALAILVEAMLLALLALVLLTAQRPLDEVMILMLSFVMGLQNAVTTMISEAKVRSTHISGMATDIGIELAALLRDEPARAAARPKLKLHSLTLFAFAAGGIFGAICYGVIGDWLFLAAALVLILLALPALLGART